MTRWKAALVALGCATALAACGGDDDNETATPASAGTTTAASSGEAIVEAPPTTPPTEIQATEKLANVPPKGKKVTFLQCEFESCARYVNGMKSATEALGWTVKTQVFKATGVAGALQQAIAEKPDYIAMSGIPAAALKAQLAEAKKAGIPVMTCATVDEVAEGNYAISCGGDMRVDADYLGRWMINDSGGKAKIVGVNIPSYPSITTQIDWLDENIGKLCSDCSFDKLDFTVDEVGAGTVPQKVVGYLQANPDVNYVYFTFSDLGKGIPEVLKSSNLADRVKLTGGAGDAAIMKAIGKGQDAWTISPNEYSAWVMVDAMARLSVDEEIPRKQIDAVRSSPTWVIDSEASAATLKANNFDWFGPEDYEGQFKALWGVN